ncbi:OB-fold nucleic acid binding domain-containing protein [Nonomuraea sediminis]|uniref:OB-fold nucleic acid binding domain-containing protein n=1 Tax=Nonomuraea sediminis TaxID=2835864 RepID=UPI001BDBFBA7|nr:OB-fold nucleic acid binding domain-containing protein [Nonomuraea sediminis]
MNARAVVSPAQLSDYLASQGWQRIDTWRGAVIWHLDGAGEVLVPHEPAYRDYQDRLREVVRVLSRVEHRADWDIVRDITEPLTDRQFFRTQPDTPQGTTPLMAGLKALEGVRDLLKAAARVSVDGTSPIHVGQAPETAHAFLRQVRLGTTQVGSYVFTVQVPLSQPAQDALFGDGDPLPFNRRVLLRMNDAILAAHEAATKVSEHGLGIFDDYIDRGISANFCEALVNLAGPDSGWPVEVGFSWSRGLAPPDWATAGPTRFDPWALGAIKQAGQQLRLLGQGGQAAITGLVVSTRRDRDEPGRVKIRGELRVARQATSRSIWVVLNPQQYAQALDAHQEERQVSVIGQLVPTQRRLELHPSDFEVLR